MLVYVCINLYGNYQDYRITGVQPNLDTGVLKVIDEEVDKNDNDKNDKDKGRRG